MICAESQPSVSFSTDAWIASRKLRRKKLWSLAEVIQFMCWQLVRAVDSLRDLEDRVKSLADRGQAGMRVPDEFIERFVRPVITYCRMECEQIELQGAMRRIDEQIMIKLKPIPAVGVTFGDLRIEISFLRQTIDSDLIGHRFVYIENEKAKALLNWQQTWKRILGVFDVHDDVHNAYLAFSVELWSATVFYSMRAAEFGLRQLAGMVGIKLKRPIEVEDWKTILDAIDQKLEELYDMPRSPEREKELKMYSDAASHLRYLKEWRNEMAHARSVYNEGEASSALTRVRELMELMCPPTP